MTDDDCKQALKSRYRLYLSRATFEDKANRCLAGAELDAAMETGVLFSDGVTAFREDEEHALPEGEPFGFLLVN